MRLSRSRSISTQRPRTSASPSDCANNCRISAARQSARHRASLPCGNRAAHPGRVPRAACRQPLPVTRGPRRTVAAPRRGHADHHARRLPIVERPARAAWPRRASTAADGRSRRDRPWLFSHGQLCDARCTGSSSDNRRSFWPRRRTPAAPGPTADAALSRAPTAAWCRLPERRTAPPDPGGFRRD